MKLHFKKPISHHLRAALMAFGAVTLLATSAHAGPLVRTANGVVEGVVVEDKADKAVEAYLGLPFAAPPVGELRWSAPRPASAWQGKRDATRFAAACYQGVPRPWGPYSAEFLAGEPLSEDCLYLNVWKPAGAGAKRPVLVFIHGGGFGGGAGHLPVYDGAALAARGVVVITINYRVGVLGFMAHPALTAEDPRRTSGNYGLLDQIAALKWVQRNVARFGGDPRNVTLAGESAGAASVNYLQVSPLARGLFAKAISFSGASMAVGLPPLAEGEQAGTALARRLGAGSLPDLRKVSAADLIAATSYVPTVGGSGPPPLVWVPRRDGVVIPADPTQPATPRASRVPLLTGFNAAEMIDPSVRTPADLERALRGRYGSFADRLLALYPHASDAEAQAANVQIARDRYMSGLVLWAAGRAQGARDPIWLYRHDQPFPPVPGGPSYGAFHSSQLAYVFGNLGLGGRQFGDADRRVVGQWQDRLLAFLRSGDPSLPGSAWPSAARAPGQVMVIGEGGGASAAVSTPERFEAFRAYAAQGGRLGLM